MRNTQGFPPDPSYSAFKVLNVAPKLRIVVVIAARGQPEHAGANHGTRNPHLTDCSRSDKLFFHTVHTD